MFGSDSGGDFWTKAADFFKKVSEGVATIISSFRNDGSGGGTVTIGTAPSVSVAGPSLLTMGIVALGVVMLTKGLG